MPKIILYFGLIGCAFLVIATVYLIKLNWSAKIMTPPSVIFLGAVVTTFITTLLLLKESKIELAFPTSIVLDKNEQLPAMFLFNPENKKVSMRLSSLASLARPFSQTNSGPVMTVNKPSNFEETNTFCLELLQYKIFRDIEYLQRRAWSVEAIGSKVTSSINVPIKLSETEEYQGKELLKLASTNRFSNSDTEQFQLEHGKLSVPLGTAIKFDLVPSSPESGPTKYRLVLEKPYFFTVEFTIEGIGSVTVPSAFPEGVKVPQDQVDKYQTYLFLVRMTAVFHKWTSENWKTEEYKNWVTWLFREVQNELSD